MPYLGYRNSLEKLAERFHTTPEVLAKLNTPNMTVRAGVILRVPNVPDPDEPISEDDVKWRSTLATLGVSARQPAEIGRAHVELQSLMHISYAVFCLKKKKNTKTQPPNH